MKSIAPITVLTPLLCFVNLVSGKCFSITSPPKEHCSFYDHTTLNQNDHVHAASLVTHFIPPFKLNCSSLPNIFICASHSPLCQNPNYRFITCRQFCFHVYHSRVYFIYCKSPTMAFPFEMF